MERRVTDVALLLLSLSTKDAMDSFLSELGFVALVSSLLAARAFGCDLEGDARRGSSAAAPGVNAHSTCRNVMSKFYGSRKIKTGLHGGRSKGRARADGWAMIFLLIKAT